MSKYVLAFRGQQGDRAHQPDEGQQWGAWFAGLGTRDRRHGQPGGRSAHPGRQ